MHCTVLFEVECSEHYSYVYSAVQLLHLVAVQRLQRNALITLYCSAMTVVYYSAVIAVKCVADITVYFSSVNSLHCIGMIAG